MPGTSPSNDAPPGNADESSPNLLSGLPDDVTVPAGAGCGENTAQGMWLTASAWLPAELLTALSAAGGPGDHGAPPVAAAFCQGGPLDQLPPGPVLAAFLADASGSAASTSTAVDDPPAASHTSTSTATGGEPAAGGAADPFNGLAGRSDSELIGVIRGWRKQAALAAAGELAAVAELAARRHAQAKAAGEWNSTAIGAADDEIAAALTLTSRATSVLTDRAATLRGLPATFAALAAGRIDMPKALVISTSLNGQDPELARAVEAQVIGRAPAQTTGQLRAALHRALLAADPDAAERRRQAEEKHARIERAPEPGGCTATLAGRYLPVTATVAAWNRITALAHQLRQSGAPGTLDELRVHVYLALLSGQPTTQPATVATGAEAGAEGAAPTGTPGTAADGTADTVRSGTADAVRPGTLGPADDPRSAAGPSVAATLGDTAATGPGSPDTRADAGPRTSGPAQVPASGLQIPAPGLAPGDQSRAPATAESSAPFNTAGAAATGGGGLVGTVNLTVPLSTLLGLTDSPGDLGGFGPITAHTARGITAATLNRPAVRWCATVTGDNGQAIGHGCAAPARPPGSRRGSPPGEAGAGWAFTLKLTAFAGIGCAHEGESTKYRPPPLLWHLIQIRNQRCTFPGCRMPAAKCDDDHTLAYEKGGRTCECNLGPLCRHHHRVKQSQGWRLEQPEPGIFAWVTPSGWKYITGPENHAA